MGSEYYDALEELAEFTAFYMRISKLSPKEMVKRIEERDPSFIEHVEKMEKPPKSSLDFWSGFGIWTITRLRSKYSHIWNEVADSYLQSNPVIWAQIDEILNNSRF
jgi:hypothetical protein